MIYSRQGLLEKVPIKEPKTSTLKHKWQRKFYPEWTIRVCREWACVTHMVWTRQKNLLVLREGCPSLLNKRGGGRMSLNKAVAAVIRKCTDDPRNPCLFKKWQLPTLKQHKRIWTNLGDKTSLTSPLGPNLINIPINLFSLVLYPYLLLFLCFWHKWFQMILKILKRKSEGGRGWVWDLVFIFTYFKLFISIKSTWLGLGRKDTGVSVKSTSQVQHLSP